MDSGAESFYYLRISADNQPYRRALPDDQVDLAVEVFRMLADATRVRILWTLIGRELSVNQLAGEVGKLPASVSQHLAKLRMTRLVQTRREGTQIFYRLENEHVAQLITDAIYNAEHNGPEVPGHHLADSELVQLHSDAEDG
ncbi:MAG TPA: metalloregulator ArsR/SmtB family transcription factor [Gaiellales bacterium]|nr:metalloregulator ArsR/SmtB family transcription factor [Gaiellales bacterium]